MSKLHKLLFCVFIFLLSSCSKSQNGEDIQATALFISSHPFPTPSFVNQATLWYGNSGFEEALCISIAESAIWKPGQFYPVTYDEVNRSFQISIDGYGPIKVSFYQSGGIITRYDGNSNIIGSHGGTTTVCFDGDLTYHGNHYASIQFESGGIQYKYIWNFKG